MNTSNVQFGDDKAIDVAWKTYVEAEGIVRDKVRALFKAAKSSKDEKKTIGLIARKITTLLLGLWGKEKPSEEHVPIAEVLVLSKFPWHRIKIHKNGSRTEQRLKNVLKRANILIRKFGPTTAVYSDWLEERGFLDAAEALRQNFDHG